ncbi:MAG: GNAT family N-acetyltransferase [Actinomycetales bacterium]|nr:GNAT family N-acetyltransferase [Actinomycetales bacterium]
MTAPATIGHVRPLTSRDLPDVERLIAEDPVAHCFVSSRVHVGGLDPWQLGGEMLGYVDEGGVRSALYCGANLVPVATTPESRAAFADRLRQTGRRCSSFVGPAEEVLDLWRLLEPAWGPAREVRANQPLMVIDQDPRVDADPAVRLAEMDDLDLLLPACIEMFTAEVGVSPVAGGLTAAYRSRIAELVRAGRSFVRIDGDTVVFKAEVGALAGSVSQVQGVWVDPQYRGRGLSESGMAAVVRLGRRSLAPTMSLYVNDFNTAARKAYRAVGFRETDTFATILF